MKQRISKPIRNLVGSRANQCCEYYGVPEKVGFASYECDHIISEKQGGDSNPDNLAYSCQFCNRAKGTNIASFQGQPPVLLPLFNPRIHAWKEHFRYAKNGRIHPRSPIGEGTIFVLNMNDLLWVERRSIFFAIGIMDV